MSRLVVLFLLAGCASPPMPPAVMAPEAAGLVLICTTPTGGRVYGPPNTSGAISTDQGLICEKKAGLN